MKRNTKRKDFNKFTKASTHKRRAREEMKRALIRELEAIGVGHESCVIGGGDIPRKRGGKDAFSHSYARGVFSTAKGGYGFVTPENDVSKHANQPERDVFIPAAKTYGAIDGDLVECTYRIYRGYTGSEKTEGRVTKILQIGRQNVIGTLVRDDIRTRGKRAHTKWYVLPDDSKVSVKPIVADTLGAREGDKVSVKLLRGPGFGNAPQGEITAVFGNSASRVANYEAILADCEIPAEFSREELEEAERVAGLPIDSDRIRYTGAPVFTIDGEGAKDLDDAISLRRVKSGWYLGVHIADVSEYVGEKTALDRCVMRRGTSVYFTDKVVPMLPPVLSNGACSLNPGEDKCTLSAMITLNSDGEIRSLKLVPSVIRSRVRGVYSEVNSLFSGEATREIREKYREVYPSLVKMRELYSVLCERSKQRGMLELELPESEIILDEDGEPRDVLPRERGIAERMIEQFMLVANEAVATFLLSRGIPCVYRVHEPPPEDRLRDFVTYIHNLGFDTSHISMEKCSPSELSALICAAEGRGLSEAVSYSMLRSMSKAYYSERPGSHFGLSIEHYCHFTSPIRRLSDLATHRIIHKVLLDGAPSARYSSYAARAARAASDCEERALAAERRIEDLYKTIYMSHHIGDEYSARVNSVQSFGLFATLENTCEGLVPLSTLPGYFIYDEKNSSLRSSSLVLRVGDRITVRVEEADVSRGRVGFSIVL